MTTYSVTKVRKELSADGTHRHIEGVISSSGLHYIRAVDLFCGVGGLTHGLARGGVNVRAGVDVDPACEYPYEANNRAKFVEEDVNALRAERLAPFLAGGDFSLLAGCAPCQPFSTYSRSGRSKKRPGDWQLVKSFGRLIEELQPDLVTMENVAQLADHSVFSSFKRHLKGYSISWSIVECATIGIPQSRRRLVLLASRLPGVEIEMPLLSGPKMSVRQAIGTLPKIAAGERDELDPLHTASRLSSLNLKRIKSSKPGGTWRDWDPKLRAACHTRSTGATYPSVYGRMEWDDIRPELFCLCVVLAASPMVSAFCRA